MIRTHGKLTLPPQFRRIGLLTNVITSHIQSAAASSRISPPTDRRMTNTCLTFRDLTLGYGSHPAIHH
ncbi:hypothetical protein EN974_34025, partial [Mesorhizobium sp. M7A.F.Ca.CA.001.12.2.1]